MVQSSPPRGAEDPQAVSKWEKESHEATRELLKVKDRLIEVERNVSEHDIKMCSCEISSMRGKHTYLGCLLWCECSLICLILCVCFCPECNAAGGEGGPEEPAQTAGDSKLQPAGSDSGCAETDGIFAGEQYDAADAERQAAGNPPHILHNSPVTSKN